MSKKKVKPEANIHKFVSNNTTQYVLAIDPGRYCGVVLQAPQQGYYTILSSLFDLGEFKEWWKIAENLRNILDQYRGYWTTYLTTVIVERQTSTHDTLTMIEAYVVMYFLQYGVNVISMSRRCAYYYMKQFIPDLRFERDDMKPRISDYIWNHMLDTSGKMQISHLTRLHDLADCVAMIRAFVEYSGNIRYSTV